jgi:hypothetical protein
MDINIKQPQEFAPDKDALKLPSTISWETPAPESQLTEEDLDHSIIKDIEEMAMLGVCPSQLTVFEKNHHPESGHPQVVLDDEWLMLIIPIFQAIREINAGKGKEVEQGLKENKLNKNSLLNEIKSDIHFQEELGIDDDKLNRLLHKYKDDEIKWYNIGERSMLINPLTFFYIALSQNTYFDLKHKTREKCFIVKQIYERMNFKTAPNNIYNTDGENIGYPEGRLWSDPEWDDEEKLDTLKKELERLRKRWKKHNLSIDNIKI